MSRRPVAPTAPSFAALVVPVIVALALSACASTSTPGGGRSSNDAIDTRWVGRSAGEFFARFSPPISDSGDGATTIYNWRGGYDRIRQQSGRTARVSCSAKITVSADYKIRDITVVSDRPGANGPSYCTELLTAP